MFETRLPMLIASEVPLAKDNDGSFHDAFHSQINTELID